MTEHRISFKVDGEPVPAPRPRTVTKGGKTWTYAGNKQYRAYVKAISAACPEIHHFEEANLKVIFYTDKKQDIDNLIKGVLDALTGHLWDNDKVVWGMVVYRFDLLDGMMPRTEIEVVGEEPPHVQAQLLTRG